LLHRHRRVHRPGAVGDRHVEVEHAPHDQPAEQEQRKLREPLRAEHLDVADLGEPQHLGPELREREQHKDEEAEHEQRRDQWAATASLLRGGSGR